MVPLFRLMLVTISKSENRNSARSLRFIDCPETMVTRSCLRNVRSAAAKCISPSISDSICSSSMLSFSVQLIFTAISCTRFCDSISDSWSGCLGSVCFSSVCKNRPRAFVANILQMYSAQIGKDTTIRRERILFSRRRIIKKFLLVQKKKTKLIAIRYPLTNNSSTEWLLHSPLQTSMYFTCIV